jgi:hypothetical protein
MIGLVKLKWLVAGFLLQNAMHLVKTYCRNKKFYFHRCFASFQFAVNSAYTGLGLVVLKLINTITL